MRVAGLLPGLIAIGVILGIIGSAFIALVWTAPALNWQEIWNDTYLWRVVRFTVWQASLSTIFSVGLALPVTRALARRQRFPGRHFLIRLFGLPVVIPTLVAVFGIVAIYGQSGWLNDALALAGFERGQFLYGLNGILIAHVFFNMPLAVRLLLPLWQSVPGETWRVASQLGMRSFELFKLIEWPLLKQALPGVAGLVFMLCFTSFAVVLTLGGGPKATTIEVAIYQSLRFDFDLARAVALSLLQLGVCIGLVTFIQSFAGKMPVSVSLNLNHHRPDLHELPGRIIDWFSIVLATVMVASPLIALVTAGITGPVISVVSDPVIWRGAIRSLVVALSAGLFSLILGWLLLVTVRDLRLRRGLPRWADTLELGGSMILVVPPLVLGTGLFVMLSQYTDIFALGLVLVIIVNTLMGLPYVIRVLGAPMQRVAQDNDRLCAALGIRGYQRLRLVEWPLLRRPIGLALALSTALALGDLGAIALFGSPDTATLPLLLYQRLAGYQMGEAAVTALLLLIISALIFVLIERGIGGRDKT